MNNRSVLLNYIMFHNNSYDLVMTYLETKPKDMDVIIKDKDKPSELLLIPVYHADCMIIPSGWYFLTMAIKNTFKVSFTLQLSSALSRDMHYYYKNLSTKTKIKDNYILNTASNVFDIPIKECTNRLLYNSKKELYDLLPTYMRKKICDAFISLNAFTNNVYRGPSKPGYAVIRKLLPENYSDVELKSLLVEVQKSVNVRNRLKIRDWNTTGTDNNRYYSELIINKHLVLEILSSAFQMCIDCEIKISFFALFSENTGHHYPHVDHKRLFLLNEDGQLNRKDRDLIFFLALEDDTKIHVELKSGLGYETITLDSGDMIIMTADYIHAGYGNKEANYRISGKIGIGKVLFDPAIDTTDNYYLNQSKDQHELGLIECHVNELY